MERIKYFLPDPEDRAQLGQFTYYWACALCGKAVGVDNEEQAKEYITAHARIIFLENKNGQALHARHIVGRHIQMGKPENLPSQPTQEEKGKENYWVALTVGPLALEEEK